MLVIKNGSFTSQLSKVEKIKSSFNTRNIIINRNFEIHMKISIFRL
jgi:hypothetical protein